MRVWLRRDRGRPAGIRGGRLARASLCAVALLLGCRAGEEPAAPAAPEGPTSEFRGIELVQQESDGASWRLSAAEGEGWEGSGTGELRAVTGVIRRGGRSVQFEAGLARVDEMDVIRLSDGVEVAWGEYRALVDRAEYRRRQGRVTSDAAVVLEGPALEVRGTGLELDVEGRVARIGADVRAQIRGRAR